MSVRNEVPSPMKSPIKMLGMAAGIATRRIRKDSLAPKVLATSREDARVFEIADAVSMLTGNQTARAMTPMEENRGEGERTMARGIQAGAGIGPMILSRGMPQ